MRLSAKAAFFVWIEVKHRLALSVRIRGSRVRSRKQMGRSSDGVFSLEFASITFDGAFRFARIMDSWKTRISAASIESTKG